jgi:serine/threonine protein phosphatase 1
MPAKGEAATMEEMKRLFEGSFLPASHVAFMRSLPYFYEDEHAIYVHGGLPEKKGVFLHPSEVKPPTALCWCRDKAFFRDYRGKLVVFGHTATEYLPPELSSYTPEDPKDLWAGPCCAGIDTRCGKGGYLTALELPNRYVYESRRPPSN